jgi:thymidylate synthase (FAD)
MEKDLNIPILENEEMWASRVIDEEAMKVKLVSYSKPERQFVSDGLYDCQDLVAYCARVSNPSNQFNTETSEKLIKYLIKHQHWSPLEMVSVCLEIETTRDIARQILRHRSFSFQEFSQRYADPTKELDFVIREARLQDTKNRQNSIEIDYQNDEHRQIAYQWENLQRDLIRKSQDVYEWATAKGIAKEQARAVLPEGLTKSRLYMNGTLRSWIHYVQLRAANGTQKEHADIARECAKVIATIFPLTEQLV